MPKKKSDDWKTYRDLVERPEQIMQESSQPGAYMPMDRSSGDFPLIDKKTADLHKKKDDRLGPISHDYPKKFKKRDAGK